MKPGDVWSSLAGAVPALRKRLRETKIVCETVPMVVLVVVLGVATILVVGAASFLVLPWEVPAVAIGLFLVWMLKLAAGSGHHPPATSGVRSALVTVRQSLLAATRKVAALEWIEVVGMLSGAILVVILAVAVILVVGAAAVLVLPVAVPVAALALVLVGLAKLAAGRAGDD